MVAIACGLPKAREESSMIERVSMPAGAGADRRGRKPA